MAVYRDYDVDALETQYDIEATVSDVSAVMEGYRQASERLSASRNGLFDLPYGTDPLQRLDAFPPDKTGAPVMVYVHGGYWVGGDKASRRFPAALFNEAGAVWAPINYRLAPDAGLDDMAADVRTALAWIYRNAESIGGDPDRIYVTGTSAGGHLTGILLAPGWHEAYGVPETLIKGACLCSGLYDLEPFLHIDRCAYLRLDEDLARRNSPLYRLPSKETACPMIVAWGSKETDEFRRQSAAYAEACAAQGLAVEAMPHPEHDHFSLIGELGRPDSPLFRALLAQMGRRPAS